MLDIRIEKTTTPKALPAKDNPLTFGTIFTDHMFIMNYDTGEGWHDARIVPFGEISLHPACTVFHYGAEVFDVVAIREHDSAHREIHHDEQRHAAHQSPVKGGSGIIGQNKLAVIGLHIIEGLGHHGQGVTADDRDHRVQQNEVLQFSLEALLIRQQSDHDHGGQDADHDKNTIQINSPK